MLLMDDYVCHLCGDYGCNLVFLCISTVTFSLIRWGQLWFSFFAKPDVMWNGAPVNYDQSVIDIKAIQPALSTEITALISYVAMQPLKWPLRL